METLTSSSNIGLAMAHLEDILNQDGGESVIEMIREFKRDSTIDDSLISELF